MIFKTICLVLFSKNIIKAIQFIEYAYNPATFLLEIFAPLKTRPFSADRYSTYIRQERGALHFLQPNAGSSFLIHRIMKALEQAEAATSIDNFAPSKMPPLPVYNGI